jgi:hypothetical protein
MANNTRNAAQFLRIGRNRVHLNNVSGVLFWGGSLRIFNSSNVMIICDRSPDAEIHFQALLEENVGIGSSLTLPNGSFISQSMVGNISKHEEEYLAIQDTSGYRVYRFDSDKYNNLDDVADAIFDKLDGVTTDIDWDDLAVPTEEGDTETTV